MQKEIDNLCKNIAVLRDRNHLPKDAMAKVMGISSKTLEVIESGVLPDGFCCDSLARIQDAFGIPMNELFLSWETE